MDVDVGDEMEDSADSGDPTGTEDETGGGTDTATGDDSDSGGDETTDTGEPCEGVYSKLVWVEDAESTNMQVQPALGLPDQPQFAYSEEPNVGSVVFPLPLECTGTYHTWGLVWDRYPGNLNPNNADSFTALFDELGTYRWEYGCGTESLEEGGGWSWQRLENFIGTCPQSAVAVELEPGEHTFTVTNIESGNAQEGNYAGIAAILISTNPSHDPYLDYNPNR